MYEVWKPIVDYESRYDVSNLWRVRRKHKCWTFNILVWTLNHKWYKRVILSINNIPHTYSVHRLVALTFIPNIENKPQVNHIDWDKLNNNVYNLEWCTNSENIKHAINNGLFVQKKWIESSFNKEVKQYSSIWEYIRTFYNAREANEILWIHFQNISKVCLWLRKKAGWFIWKYSN
mgnify:CR=1 FL=1